MPDNAVNGPTESQKTWQLMRTAFHSSLRGEMEAIIYFNWLFLSAAPAPFFIAAAACMSATLGGRTNALRSLRL